MKILKKGKPDRSWIPARFGGDCFTAFAMTGEGRTVRFGGVRESNLTGFGKPVRFTTAMIAALMLMATSCRNDGFYYQDEARARIEGPYEWSLGADSLDYSFAFYPSTVTETAMPMTLYLMGETAGHDRTVRLEAVADATTATATHYTLPTEVIIPANKYSAPFDVVLKRTADLTDRTVRLRFRIVDNADFKAGVAEKNTFTLNWNDMLSKPRNWDDLTEFFGTFSITKYRFIIDTLAIGEFDVNTMTWGQLNNYKILLRTALAAYNEAHPGAPLRDENGQLVTF